MLLLSSIGWCFVDVDVDEESWAANLWLRAGETCHHHPGAPFYVTKLP